MTSTTTLSIGSKKEKLKKLLDSVGVFTIVSHNQYGNVVLELYSTDFDHLIDLVEEYKMLKNIA